MISTYSFSLIGRDHKKANIPCHDYSLIKEISSSWKVAVVADGVGSCKHAEIASKIAVNTVADLIKKQFPVYNADKEVYKSVILASMNGAANAIEAYVEENDTGNEMEYQTTLAVAVMSTSSLYYGNAGDSGIIALDVEGQYHVLTTKQNDAEGCVYSIPNHRNFEIGMAEFAPNAVLCMTDGVFDYVVPKSLRETNYKVDVPFANIFVTYGLGIEKTEEPEAVENCKKRAINFLMSEVCEKMTDDLSIAVMVNTNSYLQPEDIKWEKPEIDYLALKWSEISVYPSEEVRRELFKDYLKESNPNLSEEDIQVTIKKYAGECEAIESDMQEIRFEELDSSYVKKEPQFCEGDKKHFEDVKTEQKKIKPNFIEKSKRGLKNLFNYEDET